jgi:NifU-like protein involved in Fe-S cluster formation
MFNDVMKALEARAKRFGPMRDANAYAKIKGTCGDVAEIWLRIDGGKIRKGSFMSDGCGWSKHCLNAAAELAEGKRPEEAAKMTQAHVLAAAGEVPEDHQHCALLAAETVQQAVENYLNPPPKQTLGRKMKGWIGK